MSQGGVYGFGGKFVHFGIPTTETLLAGATENARRLRAINPELSGSLDRAAANMAEGLTRALDDVDPEIVCRVSLHLVSVIGSHMVLGLDPMNALNVATLAAARIGGHQLTEPPP